MKNSKSTITNIFEFTLSKQGSNFLYKCQKRRVISTSIYQSYSFSFGIYKGSKFPFLERLSGAGRTGKDSKGQERIGKDQGNRRTGKNWEGLGRTGKDQEGL